MLAEQGHALAQCGRLAPALERFDAALAMRPGHLGALGGRADVLRRLARHDEALACLDRMLEIDPDHAGALLTRSAVLLECRRHDDALRCVERLLARDPQSVPALNNRANALASLRRYPDALAVLERIVALEPGFMPAWVNRGTILTALGRYDDAEANFEHAGAIAPDSAELRWNASFVKLLRGQFRAGWADYEARWSTPSFGQRRHAALPVWAGEDVRGRRVLLWHEQGLGDTLQFCRYAILVAGLGAAVVLEVQPELKTLLATSLPGIATVVASGEPLPPCDVAAPLMSLPHVFGTEGETVPHAPAYLRADPARVARWARRFNSRRAGPRGPLPRVGIACSGNPSHRHDLERSLAIDPFRPLGRAAELFIVQKDLRERDRQRLPALGEIRHLGDGLADFGDTAALLACLDLVISADTSIVHLAGALGKPVWILLPASPDWRWQLEREDSPWYPSARLFRQREAGNWGEVIERVVRALREFVPA